LLYRPGLVLRSVGRIPACRRPPEQGSEAGGNRSNLFCRLQLGVIWGAMQSNAIPAKVDVKKDQGIAITWIDGLKSDYALWQLRLSCPCAKCKEERAERARKKTLLNVLQGNHAEELRIVSAELVGNYALKLAWSDNHDTGIYSFIYLRELAEAPQR
jgi:DUF971 family protein